MGFRFQKRVSLGKGSRLNLNKRSVSVTSGGRFFRTTIGTKGVSSSFSIPGTGITYSTGYGRRSQRGGLLGFMVVGLVIFGVVHSLFSSDAPTSDHSSETKAIQVGAARVTNDTAEQSGPPKAKKKHSHSTPAQTPASPPAEATPTDDLAVVRSVDSNAADRIAAYCAGVTAKAAERAEAVQQYCRRSEVASWQRLVIQHEFADEPASVVQICSQPPFPDSFVAKEACARFELAK